MRREGEASDSAEGEAASWEWRREVGAGGSRGRAFEERAYRIAFEVRENQVEMSPELREVESLVSRLEVERAGGSSRRRESSAQTKG